EPLVSVLIPTYDNYEDLCERAIPSVLAQSYQNIELVIIGEGSPPETAQRIKRFKDPRIRYERLPLRGPYPDNPRDRWLVTAVPPFNHGLHVARGRWISPFADDDALRPEALLTTLTAARTNRYEVCYGALQGLGPNGWKRL